MCAGEIIPLGIFLVLADIALVITLIHNQWNITNYRRVTAGSASTKINNFIVP